MKTIFILNKSVSKRKGEKGKQIKQLYEERNDRSKADNPEDIFHDPSKLLIELGYEKIVDEDPIKYIKTPGTIWEFYLLRLSSVNRGTYRKLIKSIPANEKPIEGSSMRQLGNPYEQWIQNYGKIEDKKFGEEVKPFVNKLIARKCPIRQQKGNDDFRVKRKRAAKAFFKYLLGRKILKKQLDELNGKDDFDKLAYLIRQFPDDKQYIAAGLMRCLYGGKNVNWVSVSLAKQLTTALRKANLQNDKLSVELFRKLNYSGKQRDFKPPFKNIYDIGKRDRVNINFRVQTWLKLLNDTSDAFR